MWEVGGLGHYARSLDWNDPARERVVVCESIGIETAVVVVEPVVGGWCRLKRVHRQRQICEVGDSGNALSEIISGSRTCRACFGVGEVEMGSPNDFAANPHPSQRDSHPSATDNTHRGRRERARAVEVRRSGL